jgi:hypothetical protein
MRFALVCSFNLRGQNFQILTIIELLPVIFLRFQMGPGPRLSIYAAAHHASLVDTLRSSRMFLVTIMRNELGS